MKMYSSGTVHLELSGEEIHKLLLELRALGKYQYINELEAKYPTLHKLAANIPSTYDSEIIEV